MAKKETEEEKRAHEMVEEIASNIASLGRSVTALLSGRLKQKTLLILLAHSSSLSQNQVARVLEALKNLETTYLK